jgi:hypothetical protein
LGYPTGLLLLGHTIITPTPTGVPFACLQIYKAWTVGTVFALPIHSIDPAT